MLGRDLVPRLVSRHFVIPLDRNRADVTSAHQIMQAVLQAEPDLIIHAAAFTAVDDCERQPDLAFRVNAQGTLNIARAASEHRIPVLYISTDYVFDGEKSDPYVEGDKPNPPNVYGRTKLEGERHVQDLLERFWIVRVSWLFGPRGKNFVRAILDQARQGRPLRVVDDQVGAPTYTTDLAQKLEEIAEHGSPGIYHVTNQGYCSWFDFAKEILRQAGLENVQISPISTSEAARLARRPRNSRLAPTRLQTEGMGLLPGWQDALHRYLTREVRPNP